MVRSCCTVMTGSLWIKYFSRTQYLSRVYRWATPAGEVMAHSKFCIYRITLFLLSLKEESWGADMPVPYYVFVQYNSSKVVLSKNILTVVRLIMLSVFVWITDLPRTSQGPSSLLQLCHRARNPIIFCSVPVCNLKTGSSDSECRCQEHSWAQDRSVASPLW